MFIFSLLFKKKKTIIKSILKLNYFFNKKKENKFRKIKKKKKANKISKAFFFKQFQNPINLIPSKHLQTHNSKSISPLHLKQHQKKSNSYLQTHH